jgi:hypothetical protein
MAVDERNDLARDYSPADTAAGFLAVFAVVAGVLAIFWYPGRLGAAALLVGLIAAAIGGSQRRLVGISIAIVTLCWFVGMVFSVVTDRPIF